MVKGGRERRKVVGCSPTWGQMRSWSSTASSRFTRWRMHSFRYVVNVWHIWPLFRIRIDTSVDQFAHLQDDDKKPYDTAHHSENFCTCSLVVSQLVCWIRDLEVMSLSLTHCVAKYNPEQANHLYTPPSPCNIIWFWPKSGDALKLVTYCRRNDCV